jgi:8-oxo-dGTP diphosphatase
MGEDSKQWVAVTVWVFRGESVLSMQRSASQPAGPGLWEGVSGRVLAGEDPVVAARREVVEETGLLVRISERPVTAYSAVRRGDPMTVIVFRGDHEQGEVTLSEEHDAYRWCTVDELSELGVPAQLIDAARMAR